MKKEINKQSKIIYIICAAIALGTIIGTILNPKEIMKLNIFKRVPEQEQVESQEQENINNSEPVMYLVKLDTYYALAIDNMVDNFDDYFAYTTPDIKNGVVEAFGNLGYYMSDTNKGYQVLNPEVAEPDFYLIVKVKEITEESKKYDFDGGLTMLVLKNKSTGEIKEKVFNPYIKFRVKEENHE